MNYHTRPRSHKDLKIHTAQRLNNTLNKTRLTNKTQDSKLIMASIHIPRFRTKIKLACTYIQLPRKTSKTLFYSTKTYSYTLNEILHKRWYAKEDLKMMSSLPYMDFHKVRQQKFCEMSRAASRLLDILQSQIFPVSTGEHKLFIKRAKITLEILGIQRCRVELFKT